MSAVIPAHDLFLCAVTNDTVRVLGSVLAAIWEPGAPRCGYLTTHYGVLHDHDLTRNGWSVLHAHELNVADFASDASDVTIRYELTTETRPLPS